MRKTCWVWCDANHNAIMPLKVEFQLGRPKSAPLPENTSWTKALPKLKIRSEAKDCAHPVPKRGSRTKPWPWRENEEAVLKFKAWCIEFKQAADYLAERWARCVARFLHLLAREDDADEQPLDLLPELRPEVLAAVHMQGLHMEAFSKLDILLPVRSWTEDILCSMKICCEYTLAVCRKENLAARGDDENYWPSCIESIGMLLKDLGGPLEAQVRKAKAHRLEQNKELDAQRLSELPTVEHMKDAVHRAMLTLQAIAEQGNRGAQKVLTVRQHRAATIALVGIIALNGFMGRAKEYAVTTKEHVQSQLAKKLDYIVCSDHKTQKCYGSIAKWFAPGTVKAIECYLTLERKVGSPYFLFSGKKDTPVSVSVCLRVFAKLYLCAAVTVLILRKWFHSELVRLCKNEDDVIALFTRIDKHSVNIARKHYILTTIEDDVGLAKEISMTMLGEPVPWPTGSSGGADPALLEAIDNIDAQDEQEEGGEDAHGDDDDDCLDWWPCGRCFGIYAPMLAVADDPAAVTQALPLESGVPEPTPVAARSAVAPRRKGSASQGALRKKPAGQQPTTKRTPPSGQPQEEATSSAAGEGSPSRKKRKAKAMVGGGAPVKFVVDATPTVRHTTQANLQAFARRWLRGARGRCCKV